MKKTNRILAKKTNKIIAGSHGPTKKAAAAHDRHRARRMAFSPLNLPLL